MQRIHIWIYGVPLVRITIGPKDTTMRFKYPTLASPVPFTTDSGGHDSCMNRHLPGASRASLVCINKSYADCRHPLATLALQPSHNANRHNAHSRGTGASCVGDEDRQLKYRKLRIAWSVAWSIVAVLLIALWVRSYSKWDQLSGEAIDNTWILARSLHGEIALCGGYDAVSPLVPLDWSTHSNLQVRDQFVTADNGSIGTSLEGRGTLGFCLIAGNSSLNVFFPHWFPPVLVLAIAAIPWLRWRFSLRTLLIATTLVALVLGIIVWLSR